MNSSTLSQWLTLSQIAASRQVKQQFLSAEIRAGRLRAVDVSSNPGSGRPRWRISPEALAAWEASRTCSPPEPRTRRRRRKDPALVEYF